MINTNNRQKGMILDSRFFRFPKTLKTRDDIGSETFTQIVYNQWVIYQQLTYLRIYLL